MFSAIASSQQSRQLFVSSCIERFFTPPLARVPRPHFLFDGCDIDWEFPAEADRHNYTLLLQEFRHQLDDLRNRAGEHLLLTVAVDVVPEHMDLPAVGSCVDWLDLMAYVGHQPNLNARNKFTDFNSPLYSSPQEPPKNVTWNIDDGIKSLVAKGILSERLVLGVNAYGRAYAGVPNVNHGVYQPYTGPAPAPGGHGEPGIVAYDRLVAEYLPTYESHWDPVTHSAYLYAPTTQEWISFDSVQSARDKANYANQHQLGGMMLWELTADVPNVHLEPPHAAGLSLIDAMHATLHRN